MLDRLEARFGKYAISDLIRYVVMFNALVYVLQVVSPGFVDLLRLVPERIYAGEVWRVFTWIFIPRTMSPIWILFALLFLWFMGDILESAWTSFRVNFFYLCGWFFTTLGALFLPASEIGLWANLLLNLTIILAAATLQPNYQIMFFLVIPLKLKWLAFISLFFPVMFFLAAPLSGKIALLLCFANYFLFFGPAFFRQKALDAKAARRRAKFEAAKEVDATLHRCETCGRTEVSDPELEFRVSRDGKEYCVEHLPGRSGKPSVSSSDKS